MLILFLPLIYGQSAVTTSFLMETGSRKVVALQGYQTTHRPSRPGAGELGYGHGNSATGSIQLSIKTHDARGGLLDGCISAPSRSCLGAGPVYEFDCHVADCSRSSLSNRRDCRRSHRWMRRIRYDALIKVRRKRTINATDLLHLTAGTLFRRTLSGIYSASNANGSDRKQALAGPRTDVENEAGKPAMISEQPERANSP